MKQFGSILAMALILVLILPIFASAETLEADITKLMSDGLIPKSTVIQSEISWPEGTTVETHTAAIDKVSTSGTTMHVEIALVAGTSFSDSDWEALENWLNARVSSAIQGIAIDTESMANVIQTSISEGRNAYTASGDASIQPPDAWNVASVSVTIPYYPQLSRDVNGSATQRLQEQLILLGYLDDKADGYFGGNTKAAVEMLQRYLRELEQDWLDAHMTAAPTATPAPATTTDGETVSETAAPAPTPMTEVNGVADALTQAYLFSSEFQITREALKMGAQGDAVKRVQNRLRRLGYMTDAADGIYGGSTARSVRIFQYYNNLEVTGIADEEMQIVLFSDAAKAPDNQMLSKGSTGEAVKTLQQRLKILGFTKSSADGDFGDNTVAAVKNLQTYMRAMEIEKVQADADKVAQINAGTATLESFLTVEVNGIADPLLLDDFYSDDFPAIPVTIQSGSFSEDVVRLQRRLSALEYYYGSLDGDYGSGTKKAVANFQKRHDLEETGVADYETLKILFSEDAKKALKPYVLKVSLDKQRVYAYAPDENGEYTDLVRTMKCSTGKDETPTPTGTFQSGTGPASAWYYFKEFDCWAQYGYYIDGGIMFHSVLYNEKNGKVNQSSINHLGKKASHGCIRLSVEDAKWIYQNCPRNTKVIIY